MATTTFIITAVCIIIMLVLLIWLLLRIIKKRKAKANQFNEAYDTVLNDFNIAEEIMKREVQKNNGEAVNPYPILYNIGRYGSQRAGTGKPEVERRLEQVRTGVGSSENSLNLAGQGYVQPVDNVPDNSNIGGAGQDKKRDKSIRFNPI